MTEQAENRRLGPAGMSLYDLHPPGTLLKIQSSADPSQTPPEPLGAVRAGTPVVPAAPTPS